MGCLLVEWLWEGVGFLDGGVGLSEFFYADFCCLMGELDNFVAWEGFDDLGLGYGWAWVSGVDCFGGFIFWLWSIVAGW